MRGKKGPQRFSEEFRREAVRLVRHSTLGYLTPVEYEEQVLKAG